MKQQDKQGNIPTLVGQALHWLRSMKIPYAFRKEAGMWQFTYKETFISILNDVENTEIAFFALLYYEDELKDEEIQKMVFEFAIMLVKDIPDFANAEITYMSEGFGYISIWYSVSNPKYKPRLFMKKFIEVLDNINKLQLDFCLMCDVAYEALFNPPIEVLRETLCETDKYDCNE